MSIIGSIRSFLAPSAPATTFATITINSSADELEIPFGFFNVECHSGRVSLGYKFKDGSRSYQVGSVVVDGGKRIAAPENREELPTVVLNFQKTQNGVQHIGGCRVIDTAALDGDNSTVIWEGKEPPSGIGWH